MFNKIKTKWLVVTFVILLILSAIVLISNNSKSTISRNRTFKSELTDFDSAKVSQIYIYPKNKNTNIILSKSGKDWKVTVDNKKYNADPNTIKGMISTLLNLRAIRVAAKNKSEWAQYELTDSAASRVQLVEGKKTVVDLYLGKFSYQQPKNTNPYYYQQQGKMTSYVRLAGDKTIYAVDGLIAMSFNRKANDFRNRTIIHSNKEAWNRLVFNGPDKTYELNKQGNNWTIDGLAADSASVSKYLSSLAWLSNSNFVEESVMTSDKPLYTLSIEGENMPKSIKVSAFPADTTNQFAISSSLNEGAYFSGGKNGLFDKIFVGKEYFSPENTPKKTGNKQ
jgi:hypothetical protein